MESVIQVLAVVLPTVALSSVALILLVNLYLKIRRLFLVKVNCWFCNQWTKVHYDQQNCFECPTCLQYNGFNSDGDYNKPIPAQQDELLNRQVPITKNVNNFTSSSSNGLCHLCNNNQQLKIYQLANFIPLNEANFDVEIEHFQKQLEKAYKLCPPCEKVVKKTVRKQNCFLGLKFSELRRKALLLLDLNNSQNGISKQTKRLFLKNLVRFTLIGFAILNLIFVLSKFDFSDKNLKKITPKWLWIYVLEMKNICCTVLSICRNVSEQIGSNASFMLLSGLYKNGLTSVQHFISKTLELPLVAEAFSHFNATWGNFVKLAEPHYVLPELPTLENAALLCFVGALLQFILMLWDDKVSFKRKSFHFVLWIVLIYAHLIYPSKHFNVYGNAIQIITSSTVVTSMWFTKNLKRRKPRCKLKYTTLKGKSNYLGDFSDNEELENSFVSSKSSTFKKDFSPSLHIAAFNSSMNTSPVQSKPIFGQPATLENQFLNRKSFDNIRATSTAGKSLNRSFISAKSCTSDQTTLPDTANFFSSSLLNRTSHSPNSINVNDFDIDISLNKLHLGSPLVKRTPVTNTFYTNSNLSRPKPVISPAKLRNVTQNSWVAGGFWRDSNGMLMPVNNFSNLSRSSSQTSGFASQTGMFEPNHFSSLPSSANNSFCGDFECNSVFSEPAYYTNGSYVMQNRNFSSRLAAGGPGSTFYPILNREQVVYVSPCRFTNCFTNRGVTSGAVSPNNRGSLDLHKRNISNLGKLSFSVPGSETNKTYKPGSLIKDWIEKVDS